jgi:hypothetical protein
MSDSAEVILARLDERTKHIKQALDSHIEKEEDNDFPSRITKLETNVSWFKRLGIGVPAFIAAAVAAYKGLS